ncbi:MAG TPA: choice-of-anchor E domain-containing protein [Chitinophagaceae bacterium]|nr:choice-of-anchor E domain-containing protein [Chitinophagaceae bacterium]
MKSFLPWLGILISVVYPVHLFSQCAGGLSPSTITFDTIVYGNGNSSRDFSFPKFDPSLGTLISADLKSVVGLQYSYNLQNQTAFDKIFKTKIVRTDDITSNALDPSSVDAVNQTPYVPSFILSQQVLNYGPANMNYIMSNSVTDGRLINFMGVGSVDFDYETGTSASVQGPLPWQLNFTSVTDTTHFSITYRFCNASILSSDLLYFSVTPLKDKILLNWQQANIEENRMYSVQISASGDNFATVAAIKENNTGLYNYTWLSNSNKKIYFRIEEKNASGEIKYSNIREAVSSQNNQPGIRIFPTLYTGGNLQVSLPGKGEWRIRLYSSDGRNVSESRQTDVYTAQVEMPAELNNGIYTAEIVNIQTQQRQVTRIIVQR